MFRTERLDMSRASLHEAATASFEGLANAVGAGRNERSSPATRWRLFRWTRPRPIARAWSLVHGFTTLLLDGRLKNILHRLPEGTGVDQLLDAMLRSDRSSGRRRGRRTAPCGRVRWRWDGLARRCA
jgi:hypothetical protein